MSIFRKKKTPKPVEVIELSEKHKKLRWILFIAALALALTAFTYGIMAWLGQDPGWRTVDSKTTTGETCAPDFTFQYKLGKGASAEYKRVQQIYTDEAEYMYSVFSEEKSVKVPGNLYALNQSPNQEIEIDPVLYQALETMQAHNSRAMFLAPIYAEYENIFQSTEDWMAESFDPAKNPEQQEYFNELLAFILDPEHIDLKLMGQNRATLVVSEEYRKYAEESGNTVFVDLYWMKNAFILDHFLEVFQKEGFTHGFITSHEGFSVSLGDVGEPYISTIYDRRPDGIFSAGMISYEGVCHMIAFHDYTTRKTMGDYFYITADGQVYTPYIDEADGICKSSIHDLLVYSKDKSCADLLLEACPLFIADAWDEALARQVIEGNGVVYCRDRIIFHSGSAKIHSLFSDEHISYSEEIIS